MRDRQTPLMPTQRRVVLFRELLKAELRVLVEWRTAETGSGARSSEVTPPRESKKR